MGAGAEGVGPRHQLEVDVGPVVGPAFLVIGPLLPIGYQLREGRSGDDFDGLDALIAAGGMEGPVHRPSVLFAAIGTHGDHVPLYPWGVGHAASSNASSSSRRASTSARLKSSFR